jgi:sugar/nucleoside kinase (ribokinase family)
MSEAKRDVCGIGNAMVDVVRHVDDEFLESRGFVKGSMTLIDADWAAELLKNAGSDALSSSGGSAANTMACLASLGGAGVYLGKVRHDALGELFRKDMRASGVEFDVPAAESGPGTGVCMVFVSPDAQRTMLTYLGASATFSPADIDAQAIQAAQVTYLEGYLWDPEPAKQAFLEAADLAHRAGRRVSLTLSDSFCVDRHRKEFLKLVAEHVDILFGNQDEIVSLYQATDLDTALKKVAEDCGLAAVTCGAQGSVVLAEGKRFEIQAPRVERALDTTGAGDSYAAGFLYGVCRGYPPDECGSLGGAVAARIICCFGARPQGSLRSLAADVRHL